MLHQLADAALTDAVAAEVDVEVGAVRRAELGGLSGRAEQAASLDRLDASPVQVSAADELLRASPRGGELLSAAADPAASCVAAAHWSAQPQLSRQMRREPTLAGCSRWPTPS
ncbi:hypothetical protein [Micromonospora sp. KC723]|uniref:hypothetical protein n=1 Tax=Micromonospora sp. KC723 TaxID=2530381 RepID=UPI0010500565|nr:hypothetical protein [Micromonospora sp. KC723]TDB76185.1 hypothetical protein E1165_07875 [Micromonospora sp. KC723]